MPEHCDECNAEIVVPTIGTMRGVGFNFCSPHCRDEFASFSKSLGHVMVSDELSAPSGGPATETEERGQHLLVDGSPPPSPGGGDMTPVTKIAIPPIGILPSLAGMSMEELIENANRAHERCEEALSLATRHAIEAGDLLNEAKSRVGHGEWAGWVKRGFSGSLRTAEAYMRLAREIRRLSPEEAQRVANLPVRKALAAVSCRSGNATCREVTGDGQVRGREEPLAMLRDAARDEPLFQPRLAALAGLEAQRDRLQQEISALEAQIEEERRALDRELQQWRKGQLAQAELVRVGTEGMEPAKHLDEASACVSAPADHHFDAPQAAAQWEEF